MHPVTERLYEAAKKIKDVHGQSAVARLLNESPQTVKNWEVRGVSKAGVLKAEEVLNVRTSWLLTGEGSMDAGGTVLLNHPQIPAYHAPDAVLVPVLANSASMGGGEALLESDVIVGDLALSPHWINQHIRPQNPRELRFIHAYGDSMAPTFTDGDVLLVDTGIGARDPTTREGVYVLQAGDKNYVKRVTPTFDGKLQVTSDNPSSKTVQILNGDHQVQVLGRVVWAWNGRKL